MEECNYCGEPPDCLDHVVPFCTLAVGPSRAYGPDQRLAVGETVPACTECNMLLGSTVLPSMELRAAYVAKKLRGRHAKLLRAPAWDEEELEELAPSMQQYIRAQQFKQKQLLARIKIAETFAAGLGLPGVPVEPPLGR